MTFTTNYSEQFYNELISGFDHNLNHSGINGERLAYRLAKLAEIGLTAENGSDRMGFSKEEREAKQLVKEWMELAGLTVTEDGAGNVFGKLIGLDKDSPVIMSGSHVDTVPNGGHFDGTLGVLAALEVVEAWKKVGYQPMKSYEVVIFSDEEGSRFKAGLSGSTAMVGNANQDDFMKLVDVHGDRFQQVIERDGLTLGGFFGAKRDLEKIATFVEVHIEQGKQLEKEDLPVGVVTGIAGPCWLEVEFSGEAGHAGNTPMNDRKDALIAASQFIEQVEKLPSKVSPTAVATIGRLHVHPNGINVIPGKVTLTVDIRDIHETTRDLLVEKIIELGEVIAKEREVSFNFSESIRITPVPVSFEMQGKAMRAIEDCELKPLLIPSGAGHDAMIVGRHVPMAMLFARSKNGVSHNPSEWTSLDDCVQVTNVLKTLLEELTQ